MAVAPSLSPEEKKLMRLEVRLFAGLTCSNRELPCFGRQEFDIDAPEGMMVAGFHEYLGIAGRPLITVVNGVVVKKDVILSDNDRVGIFPPIAGGSIAKIIPSGRPASS